MRYRGLAGLLAWVVIGGWTVWAVTHAPVRQVASGREGSKEALPASTRPAEAVRVRAPVASPQVAAGMHDRQGRPVMVACQTCHATRASNPDTRGTADLDEFHQGLKLAHGQLACIACHDVASGYGRLHFADGRPTAFANVMQLCAQCHGPQYRDYVHGSHGGMTGYWDLARGPRQRNNCIDCHDPHAPQYPLVQPAAAPRDRRPGAAIRREKHE